MSASVTIYYSERREAKSNRGRVLDLPVHDSGKHRSFSMSVVGLSDLQVSDVAVCYFHTTKVLAPSLYCSIRHGISELNHINASAGYLDVGQPSTERNTVNTNRA